MITVDSNIAVPSRQRTSLYPWTTMEVDQSFFVPEGKKTSFHTSCATNGKRLGRKFITRDWVENEAAGVRVWRTL